MLVDATLLLSDNQNTASTEISDNVVDLTAIAEATQLGFVWINCVVSSAFSGGASIQVALMHDSDAAVGDGTEFVKSQVFTNAAAGAVLMSLQVPLEELDRYVGLEYTIAGGGTPGNVDAWIGMEPLNESLSTQASIPTPSPS